MATQIHAYSEVRKDNEWVAAAKNTYNEKNPNRFGWVNASMASVPVPENYAFYGLLLNRARASHPWSFYQRGMPEDVSEEVRSVSDSFGFEGYGHSHLTLKELVEKYLELMVAGQEAKELMVYLRQLIEQLQLADQPHEDVRVVFWFDD